MTIAMRAIDSLTRTQGIGDLYRIYSVTQRDGVDFNLTFIPPTFDVPHTEQFDTAYMTPLYDVGFEAAKAGYQWQNTPPGLDPSSWQRNLRPNEAMQSDQCFTRRVRVCMSAKRRIPDGETPTGMEPHVNDWGPNSNRPSTPFTIWLPRLRCSPSRRLRRRRTMRPSRCRPRA